MDRYKKVKFHCLESARNFWHGQYFYPYVVGYKNNESFMMLIPKVISTRAMIKQFTSQFPSRVTWEAMSIFKHNDRGNVTVTLILPEKVMVATAEVIHNLRGVFLGDFSNWQEIDGDNDDLKYCLSHDVNKMF